MTRDSQVRITSKLPQSGTTIFSTMSALANEHGALNLSQGFPDFDADPYLVDLVHKHMQLGRNQYAPSAGVSELREAVTRMRNAQHGSAYNPETDITITAGATQAIAAILTASIREGDEVILFTPAYDCYAPYVELNGGIPVYVKLSFPDYRIDWQQVKKVLNHRTRMIIVNTPHNPSATVFTETDLDHLEEITSGSNILILSDEVYEHIVFDGCRHISVSERPELQKRSFVVGSFGKTLHVTGWKTGYCLAPAGLMAEFRKVHQFMVFSVNTPVQYALAEYLQWDKVTDINAMYETKRDVFLKALEGSRFKALPSCGSYFQLLDYSAVSQMGDVEFARQLTIENGIASIPLSVFYNEHTDHKVLRFCFAKREQTLHEAGSLLTKL
ncbi:MAG: methionine aminotransferase [Owenweeksia sp.]